MKPLSPEEQAEVRKRLEASREERKRVKSELVAAAHAAKDHDMMPEYLWPDLDMDAWFHRKSTAATTIEKRGGFHHDVAMFAITDPDWETKHAVAIWLRRELSQLRKAEAITGSAPVLSSKAMSRIEIAEIAIELLESLDDGVGEALVCLFQELLDVDRHRKSLAANYRQLDKAAECQAQMELQGLPCGVRKLAKCLSVSPSTVTRWRRATRYREMVKGAKRVWSGILRDEYFEKILADHPNAAEPECFRRAFVMYLETLPERRSRKG